MLSIGNVSGLLSLGRVLAIPFITVGILNQFGFSLFPESIKGQMWSAPLIIILTTAIAFLISEITFQTIIFIDCFLARIFQFIGYQMGMFKILISASFMSIGLLGFYIPAELAHIEEPLLFAFGAYGIYLLDVHIKVMKSMAKKG